jgi:hypothetical protein
MRRLIVAAVLVLVASEPALRGTGAIAQPKSRNIPYRYDGFRQLIRPPTRAFDAAHGIRAITGNWREAENVDERDQVRLPSTWWTPRVGYQPVSPEDMLAGTESSATPAGSTWTIVQAKSQGVSQGFQIVDANNTRWAIKLDPPAHPELTTGADVIASKLFWAAGYNVPTNVIVTFRREDLKIKPGLEYNEPGKGDLPVTDAYIDTLLSKVARREDGTWRAVASRFLKGKPLGEIEFAGRRKDDPDDLIPHELRRELRGLWPIAAWLHHDDLSARNTLDMWVTENGRSFVRHHLLDFSGTLGAASINKHSPRAGHEYLLDFVVTLENTATLGLRRPEWDRAVDPEIPAVGFIDVETFDPNGWKTLLPNPAFDARTVRDTRWGARIVAAFDEALIRAAVKEGRFSDPRAEDYLVRVLLGRRDKLVQHWLPDGQALNQR